MRTRLRITTAAAAALAIAAVPAEAGGGAKSKVTVAKASASGASGKVKSRDASCEARRKVTLYFLGEYTPIKVGKDRTARNGKWKVRRSLDPGRYFAKVKKTADCKADESPTKRVQGAK
ncbi:MAG: hypothetical protein ACRDK9_11580 [Solirubrobacterales bacterium]